MTSYTNFPFENHADGPVVSAFAYKTQRLSDMILMEACGKDNNLVDEQKYKSRRLQQAYAFLKYAAYESCDSENLISVCFFKNF